MFSSDAEMRIYAAVLSLGLSVYFLIRRPSALASLGFTVVGLGPALMFGNVHFATIVVAVQVCAAAVLGFRLFWMGKAHAFLGQFRACGNLYTFCLLLVWVEILASSMLDWNSDRSAALKSSVCYQWLPLLILTLALPMEGAESCCRGMFLGLAAYAAAYVGPLLPAMYLDLRLQNAMMGSDRLTTYFQDAINGSRMFFFGTLGFFGLALASKARWYSKSLLFAVAGLFFGLMMLNGTKQFLLALVLALLLYLWRVMVSRPGELVLATVFLLVAFFVVQRYLFDAAGVGRFDVGLIEEDAIQGRGSIWHEALNASLAAPMTGVGFRNFGDESPVVSEETGEVAWVKDSAHGFFQSVAAEHGIVIAVVTLAAFLLLMRETAQRLGQLADPQFVLVVVVMAIVMSDNFSCAEFNAFGYHLAVLLPILLGEPAREAKTQTSSSPLIGALAA